MLPIRTWHGYVRNPTWKPGSTAPRRLPPHFNRTGGGMLEGTINDPALKENQPLDRQQRQLNMMQGQALYLQGRLSEMRRMLPKQKQVKESTKGVEL